MQIRQGQISRSRSGSSRSPLNLAKQADFAAAIAPTTVPASGVRSAALEDGSGVFRWPQVALDGYAAVPIVASDAGIRRYIARILQRVRYKAAPFEEPRPALGALARHQYDVAVLSGSEAELTWCASLRRVRSELPVLFVLQNGDQNAVAHAVNSGIDCLEAPFLESDLVARTGLLFRSVWRQHGLAIPDGESAVRLDLHHPRAHVEGRTIALTDVEYRTLWILAQGHGGVLLFRDIERSVWGESTGARRMALRRVIHNLRVKMSGRSADQHLLKTERCVGYRLINK
jgi:DNA-binding response OmpR family regulator